LGQKKNIEVMKLASKTALIYFLALLALPGCRKEDPDPPGTMRDIDGNLYRTVTIAGQTWMAENLRVAHYSDGTPITSISDNREWSADYNGMCCDYNFIADSKRGKLYNWYALEETSRKRLAPKGWHIPTEAEWKTLIEAMGEPYIAGYRLKDNLSWPAPNIPVAGVRKSGFDAVSAGERNYYGTFEREGEEAVFWTYTTDEYQYYKKAVFLSIYGENVNFLGCPKNYGFSVRCIKDKP
jgi:uncharacterized protein (TIGR02145 family)